MNPCTIFHFSVKELLIIDIDKYLIKKHDINNVLIKKMFIRLLTGLVNGSNHTKCGSLSNQKSMTQPALTNLHHNESS